MPFLNSCFYRHEPGKLRILRLCTIILLAAMAIVYLVVVLINAKRAPPSIKVQETAAQALVPDIFLQIYATTGNRSAEALQLSVTWTRTQGNSWKFVPIGPYDSVIQATSLADYNPLSPPDKNFRFYILRLPPQDPIYWGEPDWLGLDNSITDRVRVMITFNSSTASTKSTMEADAARFASLQVLPPGDPPSQYGSNDVMVLERTGAVAHITQWRNVSAPNVFGAPSSTPPKQKYSVIQQASITPNPANNTILLDVTLANEPFPGKEDERLFVVEDRLTIPAVDYLSIIGTLGGIISILSVIYKLLFGNNKYSTWGIAQEWILRQELTKHARQVDQVHDHGGALLNSRMIDDKDDLSSSIIYRDTHLHAELCKVHEQLRTLARNQALTLDTDPIDRAISKVEHPSSSGTYYEK